METDLVTTLVTLRDWFLALTPLQLGVFAGILQIVGYVLYIRKTLRSEVDPNPATWLMFAYGTTLLTILEFDVGAEMHLLLLPTICAILGVYVAYLCWHRGKLAWPKDWEDRAAFIADLCLTGAYLTAWAMLFSGTIGGDAKYIFTLVFLLCSNATTITAFAPLLRGAYAHPHREHPFAWMAWTCAYVALAIATYREYDGDATSTWAFSILEHRVQLGTDFLLISLMVYPVLNATLHGTVALLSRKTRKARYSRKIAFSGE